VRYRDHVAVEAAFACAGGGVRSELPCLIRC
jgi:hypothetical protein